MKDALCILLVKYLVIVFAIYFQETRIYGQNEIRFDHINVENGLSHSEVDFIAQDSSGCMWFSTREGLNRFNGYEMQTLHLQTRHNDELNKADIEILYTTSEDRIWIALKSGGINIFDPVYEKIQTCFSVPELINTLSSNKITYMYEDKDNNIWIGTEFGLNLYQPEDSTFVRFIHDPAIKTTLCGNFITSIYQDSQNNLWIGTNSGLNLLQYQYLHKSRISELSSRNVNSETRFRRFVNQHGVLNCISNNNVSTIFEDKQQTLWVGTIWGLNRMIFSDDSAEAVSFQRFFHNDYTFGNTARNGIYSICQTGDGSIWVGHGLGVTRFTDTDTTKDLRIQHYLFQKKFQNAFDRHEIRQLHVDMKGRLWAVPNGRTGLFYYDRQQDTFRQLLHNPVNPFSLAGNQVSFFFQDRTGILWIATSKTGINKFDIFRKPFEFIRNIPYESGSLDNNDVFALYEDHKKQLWVGTMSGLNRINFKTGKNKVYKFNPKDKNGIPAYLVGVISPDNRGFLWIGYFDLKISKFYPETERFINYLHEPDNPYGFKAWSLRDILQDSQGRVWFGATGYGLIQYKEDDSFQYYLPDDKLPGTISDGWIYQIIEDNDSTLWIGTKNGGLNHFYPDKKVFVNYTHDPENHESISGNEVRCLLKPEYNNKEILWIGTSNGLNSFNKKTGRFTLHTLKKSGSVSVIQSILEDTMSRLWISTNQGIFRFDPETGETWHFLSEDGLQGNEFNENSSFKNKDGKMYFGGSHGISAFYPEKIQKNPFKPKITLNGFKISNKTIETGDTVSNRVILKKALNHCRKIELLHHENDITFEFRPLHYSVPEKNTVEYKLSGFDERWQVSKGPDYMASYSKLSPGQYTLNFRAYNQDGIASENLRQLSVSILPPWWQTYWFRGLQIIFVILAVLFWTIIRTYRINAQKKALEREVNKRTSELRKTNEKLLSGQQEIIEQNREILAQKIKVEKYAEQLHQADEQKLRFFTNVSHEFRTPLTLIINPIEKLLREFDTYNRSFIENQLRLIHRNARRLIYLVDQVIDFRKLDRRVIKLQVAESDIIEFLQDIFSCFNDLAGQHSIDYQFTTETNHLIAWFDADKLEKIIVNLLSNAFKYSKDEGKIYLHVTTKIDESGKNSVSIKITDTGTGIPADQVNKIFNRFYQVDDKNEISGMGIGLSIVKELVELHKGKISVNSKKGEGTSFELTFPVDYEDYTSEERADSSKQTLTNKHQYLNSVTLANEVNKLQFDKSLMLNEKLSEEPDSFLILLIEDDSDMALYLSESLHHDYRVVHAKNGIEGIDLAIRYIPDIIISDVMMPVMNGIEMCKEIKTTEETSHIPVVLLTAKASEEDVMEGLETGANEYIAKPFNVDILKLKIKNMIETRNKIREQINRNGTLIISNNKVNSTEQKFITKMKDVLEKHISDYNFSTLPLSKELGMSRVQLYRKINAITGKSPSDFIKEYRLEKSANLLLKESDLSISEISFSVGFKSPSYFSKCFREKFACLPSEYSKKATPLNNSGK